jgi:soluble lytic murein transglycosylase-like protein
MPDFRFPLFSLLLLALGLAPALRAGEVLSVDVERREFSTREYQREYRLAAMDIYALSAHARHLRLPWPPVAGTDFPPPGGETLLPAAAGQHVGPIAEAAREFTLDPNLIAAVIGMESAFRTLAVSPRGARGLMQIMPETGRELGLSDPFDPAANIRAGSRYLKEQLLRFDTLEKALAAYNAGPGSVLKHGGVPPFPETQNFVRRVLERWREGREVSP